MNPFIKTSTKFNLLIAGIFLALDQYSKYWAKSSLEGNEGLIIIPDILEFFYAENTGMAFSNFSDKPLVLTIIVSSAIAMLIFLSFKIKYLSLDFALIISGGLGNLIDRLRYGYVIDFIDPVFVNFAIFNVADIALNIGIFIMLLEYFRPKKST
ncbi:MAG: signal peptidase II [Candidatus Caenarcaniphilales bacterium]|nr:signal peptidase II [Candidatus Caenarcaniphilales bacterium]